nr:seminal plasma protein HSP-1-like [Lepeophtheirus salmonis]
MCVFPFKYRGITYDNCTNADYGSRFWCAKSVYSNRFVETYEVCHDTCPKTDVADSKATAPLSPEDGCQTYTGHLCKFPFIYQGKEFDECIDNDNEGKKWCATSVDSWNGVTGFGDCILSTCPGMVLTTLEPLESIAIGKISRH